MHKRRTVKSLPSDTSEDDEPLSKLPNKKTKTVSTDGSSSESDIENYLQPAHKINLNSTFFNLPKATCSFDNIEKNILSGVNSNRLSDSESEEPNKQEDVQLSQPSTSKLNFNQLHEYSRKLEEAKRQVAAYNARKKAKEKETNIENLLAMGEGQLEEDANGSLNSDDFESCSDSEKEGWLEVAEKQKDEGLVPKDNVEITVEVPGAIKKKNKHIDLMAVLKRKLNRKRKENQVLVHKVHLLCWIAYGNHVNSKINSQDVLALALSLLPSQHCYPPERTDLDYLEKIVKWFTNTIDVVDKKVLDGQSLDKSLQTQIKQKAACSKPMLVYIFIAVLRSLGIQCRLVLSLRVEPLRPPSSELHSLSTKDMTPGEENMKGTSKKGTKEEQNTLDNKNKRSKVGLKKDNKEREEKVSAENNTKETTKKPSNCPLDEAIEKQPTKDERKPRSRAKVNFKNKKDNDEVKEGEDKVNTENNTRETTKQDTKKRSKSTSSKAIKKEQPTKDEKKGRSRSKVNFKHEKEDDNVKERKERVNTENITKETTKESSKNVDEVARKELNAIDEKKTRSSSRVRFKSEDTDHKERKINTEETKVESTAKNVEKKARSKSTRETSKPKKDKTNENIKTRSKSTSDVPQLEKVPKEKTFPVKIKLKLDNKKAPKRSAKAKEETIPQLDGANDSDTCKKVNLKKLKQKEPPCPIRNHPKRLKTLAKYADSDSEGDFETRSPFSNKSNDSPKPNGANLKKLKGIPKSVDVRQDVVDLVKKSITEQAVRHSRTKTKRNGHGSDSDCIPVKIQKKHHDSDDEFVPKLKVKRRVSAKPEEEEKLAKKGVDVWVEVFLESEEKWISVDVTTGKVHCVKELHNRASHPVSYILAWNNNNSIKDISARYCPNFNTVTRKLRIAAKWWTEALKAFIGTKTARDKEEDEELERQQLDKPLPTSITEYKNHPLYVLKRHLLKFEALYPPDAPTLGFVRKEPVYSRQCVYVLHSRDIWLKEAKVVKPGEQPYKIVKARPKWDKLSNSVITDQLLEIFGPWQTQDYDPPTAENGVVPRNAFGNVELFKPCMLPKKTVHLQLPGLNKVCRRMNIDCAPALTGFSFDGGWNHPTYDGFIVCEEFADVLVAAWELEQEEIEKREQEKVDKRVYGNWKRLIKGLLIRERLKVKYKFEGPSGDGKKAKAPKFATKKR